MDIIFDLDETLISTALRQYKIVSELIANNNYPSIETYENERKKQSLTNFQWLNNYKKVDQKSYLDHYISKIEIKEYLQFDSIKVDLTLLEELKIQNRNLFLVSMRSNEKNSMKQLSKLGLENHFKEIHFLKHQHDKENPKFEIVKKLKSNNCISYYLGDSEIDKKAAKGNGIFFLPVTSAIHNNFSNENKEINYWIKKIILDDKFLKK
ncbi:MAG: HAD family hydrolase [Crocinitomicaceae bacterium]|nr:HAD family hydrolase [Crocinitomicaceae bacterium]